MARFCNGIFPGYLPCGKCRTFDLWRMAKEKQTAMSTNFRVICHYAANPCRCCCIFVPCWSFRAWACSKLNRARMVYKAVMLPGMTAFPCPGSCDIRRLRCSCAFRCLFPVHYPHHMKIRFCQLCGLNSKKFLFSLLHGQF